MYGPVAQLVEQRIENPRVGGSIPPQATISRSTDCAKCAIRFFYSRDIDAALVGGRVRPAIRGAAIADGSFEPFPIKHCHVAPVLANKCGVSRWRCSRCIAHVRGHHR